jgi:ATP-binding cassette subfamily F protein 3
MLGQILAREVNVLFLDEPTNHLDMDSIEALTKAIENYDGSVIVVTHSEELLRRVCDRLIIFTRNGAEYFDGGYDLFLEKMGWEEEEEDRVKQKPKSSFKDNKKAKADLIRDKNKIISPIKKKIEKLEASIIKSEETLASHQKKLLEASNKGDTFKIIEFSKLVSLEQKEVEKMFELLEILQSEFDEISQDYDKKIAEVE